MIFELIRIFSFLIFITALVVITWWYFGEIIDSYYEEKNERKIEAFKKKLDNYEK